MQIWAYSILSVIFVSLLSLVGIFTFPVKKDKLEKILIYFVAFAAGTLLGDAFIHLIPEAYEKTTSVFVSLNILFGIIAFFVLEKFVHWRHCHEMPSKKHPHPFSYLILTGDAVHNFIDGLIIAAGYLVSIPVGFATTVAVIFHEIPQEIGDYGSLVYGGFSRQKALTLNFLTALTAVIGTVIALAVADTNNQFQNFLIPFAAGGFIYVAGSDLIPELHKHTEIKKSLGQVLAFVLGIVLMLLLLLFFK